MTAAAATPHFAARRAAFHATRQMPMFSPLFTFSPLRDFSAAAVSPDYAAAANSTLQGEAPDDFQRATIAEARR